MGGISKAGLEEKVKVNTRVETIAGITTFLTMAYIIFVNPIIVGSGFEIALKNALGTQNLTDDQIALVNSVKIGIATATMIAAAFGSILMGLLARLPLGLAPGMGENSFIAFTVIPAFTSTLLTLGIKGVDAATIALFVALFCVFVDGLIFLFASWSGIREAILRSISPNLAYGISVGIGIFITLIGFANSGLISSLPVTPLLQFNFKAFVTPSTLLALGGFFLAAYLYVKKFPPAFLLTIIVLTVLGMILGLASLPSQVFQTPAFTTSLIPNFPNNLRFYIELIALSFPIAFALFFVEFFDALGSITGITAKAGLVDEKGRPHNIDKALYTDAAATVIGALAGTTTTVVYIESASGVEAGGRTGFTAIVVGLLFLLSLPLAPLVTAIPSFATAPVLILVGLMFISLIKKIDFEDLTEAIPAFIAIIGIPLTGSIADGIGLAFITYTIIKLLTRKLKDINIATLVVTTIFIVYFVMISYLHT